MTLEVLVSCMNQTDMSLIERSHITSNVLLINQCDRDEATIVQSQGDGNPVVIQRMISTTSKGLSNSRNMALNNAQGDICLLCDDDEEFSANYSSKIIEAFENLPKADIIAFKISNQTCRLKPKIQRLSYLDILKIKSWQIAFRRKRVLEAGVLFDPLLGAGSENGAQEENKFLLDCRKAGLQLYYVPETIASVTHSSSTWFRGFTKQFFFQRGVTTRYMMGFFMAFLYACYYVIAKYPLYSKDISMWKAAKAILKGLLSNRLQRKK